MRVLPRPNVHVKTGSLYRVKWSRVRGIIIARPLKFDTSDRFAWMTHHWKAKNLLFLMMCYNINLVKPFRNLSLLNTRSTAKIWKNCAEDMHHNWSASNQYFWPSCMSNSIASQSYVQPATILIWHHFTQSNNSIIKINFLLFWWCIILEEIQSITY